MLDVLSDPNVDLWPYLGRGMLIGLVLVCLWKVIARLAPLLAARWRAALRGAPPWAPSVTHLTLPPLAEVLPIAVLYIRTPLAAPDDALIVHAAQGEHINGGPNITVGYAEEAIILMPQHMPSRADDPAAPPTWLASFVQRAPGNGRDA